MTKRPKLRTSENAENILALLSEGHSLREIAGKLGFRENASLILNWVRDDPDFRDQYMRAREAGYLLWADQLLAISDDPCLGPDGHVDHGAVQRARLMSDNRKWLLSRLLPRQFGDRVTQELVGSSDAPVVSRIELIAVYPPARPEELLERDGAVE
jgi:hypothetical protein